MQRCDGDPDQTFYFDADLDPDQVLKEFTSFSDENFM